MNWILKMVLGPIIDMIIGQLLSKENYQKYGDRLLDLLEEAIADSETTIDDKFLPVIRQVRKLLDIPDLPDD